MTTPKRVRPTGSLRVGSIPEGAVYVGRQCFWLRRSPYANPHTLSPNGCRPCAGAVHTRAEVIDRYREHLDAHPELVEQARTELAGRDLACWCRLDQPCHADVLLAVANPKESA